MPETAEHTLNFVKKLLRRKKSTRFHKTDLQLYFYQVTLPTYANKQTKNFSCPYTYTHTRRRFYSFWIEKKISFHIFFIFQITHNIFEMLYVVYAPVVIIIFSLYTRVYVCNTYVCSVDIFSSCLDTTTTRTIWRRKGRKKSAVCGE